MITVHALRGGATAAGYYLQRDAGCDHEHARSAVGYYVNGHDVVGRWVGRGSAALGLSGGLTTEQGGALLAELLDGRLAGEQLARPVWRTQTDANGEPARVDVRRAGYDVTFSAPKSVSVLLAVGSDDVAAQVRQAHQAAMADALALLEQLSARAARGHQGPAGRAPRIATSGLIGAAFEHTTSRSLDPQLHTHVVLVNLVHGSDGRWSALDSRTLHLQATTASHLYQHRLRAELSARLGVAWEPVERGVADIRGIPVQVRREFAQRRRQIEAALHDRGLASPPPQAGDDRPSRRRLRAAAQRACLATRPAKRHATQATLRQDWAARARAVGFGPDELAQLLEHPTRAMADVDLDDLASRVLSEAGVTRERATFNQGTVLQEICAHLPPGAQVNSQQILNLAARLVRTTDVVPVVSGDGPAFTTVDMLSTEQAALSLATRTSPHPTAAVPGPPAAAALVRGSLRTEQQRAALALLTSGRPVDVLTGPAGSGKTAALRIATEQWEQAGLHVAGTAVAAITAQGLQQATGADAVSLTRLLHDPDRHLPTGGVLLVDEAGMIGTRSLHQLLQLTHQRDCKLVLVGDPAQLPELEAGGLFTALTQQPTALQLTGHQRQRESWEQHALADLRAGRIPQALDAYDQHQRLHTDTTGDALRQRLVEDYLHARAEHTDPWQVAVLASRRSDVDQLNAAIRTRLHDTGTLGPDGLTVTTADGGDREYRTGDQVLITRNDHSRQLLNGTTGTVTAIGSDSLQLRTRDGRQHTLPLCWLQQDRLDHGYALTLHKAQGRTLHTALLLADPNLGHEAGYVGLSRGTHANHLYLHPDSPLHDDATGTCATKLHLAEPARSPRARLLQRRDAHQLALHQVPRTHDGRSR